MRTEEGLIAIIIKQIIFSAQKEEIEDVLSDSIAVDWIRFKELISYHELVPFAYLALKDFSASIPEGIMSFLKNTYYALLVSAEAMWQEFLRIRKAFEDENIKFVPIKGIAFLQDLYSQYPVRPMCDIDVLLKRKDLQPARDVFHKIGYSESLSDFKDDFWLSTKNQMPFYKRGEHSCRYLVELHLELDNDRGQDRFLLQAWDRLKQVNIDDRKIDMLSAEDALFAVVIHQRRFGKALCLKYILDTALILKKYAPSFDWDYVLTEAKRSRLYASLYFLLAGLCFFDGQLVPEYIMKEPHICRLHKMAIEAFVKRNVFKNSLRFKMKLFYLKSYFLLFDSLREPVLYLLKVPYEHFALYYGLAPYNRKTDFLYRARVFYIPFRAISGIFLKKA